MGGFKAGFGSQQLAKPGADEGGNHDFTGAVGGKIETHDKRQPFSRFILTQSKQSTAYRCGRVAPAEHGRIDEPKQLVRQSRIALDQGGEVSKIQVWRTNLFQDLQGKLGAR